jgi:hypothetical protein
MLIECALYTKPTHWLVLCFLWEMLQDLCKSSAVAVWIPLDHCVIFLLFGCSVTCWPDFKHVLWGLIGAKSVINYSSF